MTSLTPGFVTFSTLSWCRFHEARRQHLTPSLSCMNTSSTIGLWEYADSRSNMSLTGTVAKPFGNVIGNLAFVGIDRLFLCGVFGILDGLFGIGAVSTSAHPLTYPFVKCCTLSHFLGSKLKWCLTVLNLTMSIPRTFIRSSSDLKGPFLLR